MRTIGRIGEPLRVGAARRAPRLSVRRDGTAAVAMRRRRVPRPVLWAMVLVVAGLSYLGFAVDRATEPVPSQPEAAEAAEPAEIRSAADARSDRAEREPGAGGELDPGAPSATSGVDDVSRRFIDPDAVASPPAPEAADRGDIDPDAPALPEGQEPASG